MILGFKVLQFTHVIVDIVTVAVAVAVGAVIRHSTAGFVSVAAAQVRIAASSVRATMGRVGDTQAQ